MGSMGNTMRGGMIRITRGVPQVPAYRISDRQSGQLDEWLVLNH